MGKAKIKEILEKYKYPIIMLCVAVFLLLIPSKSDSQTYAPSEDVYFQDILSSTQGVGRALVLVSDNGVVVSCDGAQNARVRLDIIRAVGSYTGFSSDKITILKLEK